MARVGYFIGILVEQRRRNPHPGRADMRVNSVRNHASVSHNSVQRVSPLHPRFHDARQPSRAPDVRSGPEEQHQVTRIIPSRVLEGTDVPTGIVMVHEAHVLHRTEHELDFIVRLATVADHKRFVRESGGIFVVGFEKSESQIEVLRVPDNRITVHHLDARLGQAFVPPRATNRIRGVRPSSRETCAQV